jgi:O-antigen/teichoic acid export membrane protein
MSVRLPRFLHFFGAGVADQILLSGANFIAGFLMIRFTSDASYGQFVLAQSALLLVVSAQGAWLSGPVTIVAPAKSAELRAQMIGSLGASQTRFLRRLAGVLLAISVVGCASSLWPLSIEWVLVGTILAAWAALQREYRRSVLLVYSRPHGMLGADAIYVAVLLLGIAAALLARPMAGPLAIAGLAAAGLCGALVAHRLLSGDPGWVAGDPTPFWQEIRTLGTWSVVGAVIYWLFAQSYNYVLASRLDLTAVTNVNAARLVLTPVFVFVYGINSLLMPTASNWLASFGLARMLKRLALLALAITAIDLVYFALAWYLRDWLIVELMHKHIGDQDRLLILWACVALVFLPREVLQAALFALQRARSMAWMVGLSAAVSLSLMWVGIPRWGAAAVLIGQVAGECVNLVGMAVMLWWLIPRNAQPAPGVASGSEGGG